MPTDPQNDIAGLHGRRWNFGPPREHGRPGNHRTLPGVATNRFHHPSHERGAVDPLSRVTRRKTVTPAVHVFRANPFAFLRDDVSPATASATHAGARSGGTRKRLKSGIPVRSRRLAFSESPQRIEQWRVIQSRPDNDSARRHQRNRCTAYAFTRHDPTSSSGSADRKASQPASEQPSSRVRYRSAVACSLDTNELRNDERADSEPDERLHVRLKKVGTHFFFSFVADSVRYRIGDYLDCVP